MSERKVEWVRKLKDTYIYPAVEQMLKRSDMYPCDINGNLFSTGTQDAPVPLEPVAPKKSETDDSANAAENKEMLDALNENKIEFDTFLEKDADITLKTISIDDLPEDISASFLEKIAGMIE